MTRLIAAPAVAGVLLGAGVAYAAWTGFLWPIANTTWSVIAPRRTQPTDEDDVVA